MNDGRLPAGLVGAAVVVLTIVGVLAWLELAGRAWELGTGMLATARHLEKGEHQLADGRLKKARFEILSAEAAARRAARGFNSANPLVDLAQVVPVVARGASELGHLVSAAQHSAAAAVGTLNVAQTSIHGRDRVIVRDEDGGGRVRVDRIEALGEQVSAIRGDLGAAREELSSVQLSRLPGRARGSVKDGLRSAQRGDRALADLERGLRVLPGVLGADEPRWYLIGMQNNAELRGPGGALLRFALLRIEDGEPSLKQSETVYHVDVDRKPVDIPLPPDAWYVRGIEDAQRFGNANWSPDWPLSAKLTVAYGRASRSGKRKNLPPIAGVLGVDPPAMSQLLPGIGSLTTRGGRTLVRENVVPFLLYKAYGLHPGPGVRHAVLIDVVERFYTGLVAPAHATELLQGFGNALRHKHMQIWLADAREQRYIEHMNWDGAIEKTHGGDYLYIVEQNVGGNKLDYVETQTHEMDVRFQGSEAITRTSVDISNPVVLPQPGYWLGDSEGLHRPMINVYVPNRARLLGADVRGTLLPAPPPAVWSGGLPPEHRERGKKVWSATLEIPPQRSGKVNMRYRVPHALEERSGRQTYRLSIQHQPKVRPEELTVKLTLPTGATRVLAKGWNRTGRTLVWRGHVTEDMVLEVSWRE